MTLTFLLDILGTFSFAVSGIRLAAGKQFDWFGAYIIGLITAVGGGTLRDILLDVTPFWILNPSYFITTGVAWLAMFFFGNLIQRLGQTLFLFDAVGLGLFTIVGLTKSLDAGLPWWASILMGTLTGTVGGVIRDVLLNEVPLLFRKDIYALTCVIGGMIYWVVRQWFTTDLAEIIAATSIPILRILAIRHSIHLPPFPPSQTHKNQ
ncbi:MAG: trimeric intracellular cation channel family protein [Spirosomataceae bacterium]